MTTAALKIAEHRARGILDGLGLIGRPAVGLDREGRVVETNEPFRELSNDYISVTNGRLTAAETTTNDELQSLLRSLVSVTHMLPPARRSVPVAQGVGRPLIVTGLSISSLEDDGAMLRAVVTILDLGRIDPPPPRLLTSLFGLTQAEGKLVQHLVIGDTLEKTAKHIGIGHETARSQLKSIFVKTGTKRQAELIGLLSRLATNG